MTAAAPVGIPDAEPWRGLFGGLGPWRGVLMKVNPYEQDGPKLIAWQCPHRHPSESEAIDCASRKGSGGRSKPGKCRPRKLSRRGRLSHLLNLLGVKR